MFHQIFKLPFNLKPCYYHLSLSPLQHSYSNRLIFIPRISSRYHKTLKKKIPSPDKFHPRRQKKSRYTAAQPVYTHSLSSSSLTRWRSESRHTSRDNSTPFFMSHTLTLSLSNLSSFISPQPYPKSPVILEHITAGTAVRPTSCNNVVPSKLQIRTRGPVK